MKDQLQVIPIFRRPQRIDIIGESCNGVAPRITLIVFLLILQVLCPCTIVFPVVDTVSGLFKHIAEVGVNTFEKSRIAGGYSGDSVPVYLNYDKTAFGASVLCSAGEAHGRKEDGKQYNDPFHFVILFMMNCEISPAQFFLANPNACS